MRWFIFFIIAFSVQSLIYFILKFFKIYQNVYSLSPASHQKKQEIISFGGIGIIISIVIGVFMFKSVFSEVSWIIYLMAWFGVIGIIDDWLSIKREINKGFSIKQKFALQFLGAIIFVYFLKVSYEHITFIQALFFIIVIVGTTNSTNLTDGLDGLLSGLVIISLLGCIIVLSHRNMDSELILCWIAILSVLTFLYYNYSPAKMFMGDVGSLALGALLAGICIQIGNVWMLIGVGSIYVIETLSVIIQVLVYKSKKIRVFKMAPIHHHFELIGISEKNIVWMFWIISALFMIGYFIVSG
jgi:phospho-N-acetylmuramoyl-pentapeptide-transferase